MFLLSIGRGFYTLFLTWRRPGGVGSGMTLLSCLLKFWTHPGFNPIGDRWEVNKDYSPTLPLPLEKYNEHFNQLVEVK
jgi:hypothetical protein